MKKYLSIIVGLMLVLGFNSAYAVNDVTVEPNTQILLGNYTLLVFGTTKVIDSLSVGAGDFTVTLSPGASFSVSSADKRKFSQSGGTGITSHGTCTGTSNIAVEAASDNAAPVAVTITPSTTETCDGSTTSSSTGGSGGGGGGSGGGNNPNANIFGQAQTTTSAATQAQASSVAVAATGGATTGHVFATPLKLGSVGSEVSELQKVLVAGGYLTMPSGVAYGTFGALTQSAVKKYQAANGIDQLGNVGPATRAKLNSMAATSVAATQTTSATIEALQTQLQALQAQLLILLSQQMELLKAQQ